MPQMMPLYWMLFLFMIIMFMFMMIMLYGNLKNLIYKNFNFMLNYNKNLKWYW